MKYLFKAAMMGPTPAGVPQREWSAAFFDTFDGAKQWIARSIEEEGGGPDNTYDWYWELEKVPLNVDDPYSLREAWFFNRLGEELLHLGPDAPPPSLEGDPVDAPKFALGELVTIEPWPWNRYSQFSVVTPAVIVDVPEPSEGTLYTVDYMDVTGFLEHEHIREESMSPEFDLKDDWSFALVELSHHFKGTKKLSDDLLKRLMHSEQWAGPPKYCAFNLNDQTNP